MRDLDPAQADLVLDALATTRAIRRYRPEPIPEAHLARILWAATRAPTGSNRQSFRFLVLTPAAAEARALLGGAARALWSEKASNDGYASGSGADPTSPKARMARTMTAFADTFESAPVIVLACLVRHRGAHPTEGGSVYPGVQNLLLAARALGYGGVLTMYHEFVEADLRRVLAIPDEVALCGTIPLGRPVGGHGPVRRRPVDELVYADTWGEAPDWAVDPPGTRFTSAGPKRGA